MLILALLALALSSATAKTVPVRTAAKPKPSTPANDAFRFPKEAQVGYALADLTAPEGATLICRDCDRNFTPGSTQKLFTTWVALELLGGDRTYTTELVRTGSLTNGAVKGDLVIRGGGDPSFGGSLLGPERGAEAVFGQWLKALQQAGVKHVDGCVIGDGSFLTEEGPHPASLWEDAGNYYAGTVSGLSFNDNLYQAEFDGASAAGRPVKLLRTLPARAGIARFDNHLLTAPADSRDSAFILGGFPSPIRILRGTYPAGRRPFVIKGSLPNPAWTCAQEFRAYLIAKGIPISGSGPACGDSLALPNHASLTAGIATVSIARQVSPPLRELLRIVNQKSDNNYAAQALALVGKGTGRAGDWRGGLDAVNGWLDAKGFDRRLIHLKDGNGLSRYNWIAPAQIVRLLSLAFRDARFPEYRATLIGSPGAEGKLDRFGAGWEGRLYCKTGTLEGVSTLAGYLKAKSGKWLAFSIAANNFEARNGDGQKYFAPLLKQWADGY